MRLTEQTRRALRYAQYAAIKNGRLSVSPEHLLIGILRDDYSEACSLLKNSEHPPSAILRDITETLKEQHIDQSVEEQATTRFVPLDEASQKLVGQAADIANRFHRQYMGPEHLLMAMIAEPNDTLAALWKRHQLTIQLPSSEDIVLRPGVSFARTVESTQIPATVCFVPAWSAYTNGAKQAIHHSQTEAKRSGFNAIPPAYLLAGILHEEDTVVTKALERCSVERNALREALVDLLSTGEGFQEDQEMVLDTEALAVTQEAYQVSQTLGDRHIGTEHLLLGLLTDRGETGNLLREKGLATANFLEVIRSLKRGKHVEAGKVNNPMMNMLMWLTLIAALMGWGLLLRGCH